MTNYEVGKLYVKKGISNKTDKPYEMIVTFLDINDTQVMVIVNLNDRLANQVLKQQLEVI